MLAWREGLLAALVCTLGTACSGDSRDQLVERCTDVILYRNPTWKDVEIRDVHRGPGANAVEFGFEALDEPSGARMASRIACEFAPSDRWSLVGVRLDGHALTEAELALVNSEFLLRDLSESPERLSGRPTT
ncbi:MAG TPA: hypothetical protein VMS55_11790 [Myxococcota bacterium]|nr:hypothetical protein [Myxococcota bacterium]